MIEFIVILLISLPLIIVGCTISPDTPINLGTRIPQSELKSEEGIRRLKRIKVALMLAGGITLAGGISCIIFDWEELLFWIMLIPVTIAVIYMLLQLCMIQKNKKAYTIITLVFIGFLIILPLSIILPKTENDNDTIIKNDTLFIKGSYAKEIPISSIIYLLYLHSDETNVTHIKTRDNEEIYINFKDSARSVDFTKELKELYLH